MATWFTGIVTAGSLWWAVWLLRNERRDAERQQVSKLAIRATREYEKDKTKYLSVEVINTSDSPILRLSATVFIPRGAASPGPRIRPRIGLWMRRRHLVTAMKKGGRDDYAFTNPNGTPAYDLLKQNLSATAKIFLSYEPAPFILIDVTDAAGRRWGIDAQTRQSFRIERHVPWWSYE